jgi:hypothetical protein
MSINAGGICKAPSVPYWSGGEEKESAQDAVDHKNTPHGIDADSAKERCKVERGSVAD